MILVEVEQVVGGDGPEAATALDGGRQDLRFADRMLVVEFDAARRPGLLEAVRDL